MLSKSLFLISLLAILTGCGRDQVSETLRYNSDTKVKYYQNQMGYGCFRDVANATWVRPNSIKSSELKKVADVSKLQSLRETEFSEELYDYGGAVFVGGVWSGTTAFALSRRAGYVTNTASGRSAMGFLNYLNKVTNGIIPRFGWLVKFPPFSIFVEHGLHGALVDNNKAIDGFLREHNAAKREIVNFPYTAKGTPSDLQRSSKVGSWMDTMDRAITPVRKNFQKLTEKRIKIDDLSKIDDWILDTGDEWEDFAMKNNEFMRDFIKGNYVAPGKYLQAMGDVSDEYVEVFLKINKANLEQLQWMLEGAPDLSDAIHKMNNANFQGAMDALDRSGINDIRKNRKLVQDMLDDPKKMNIMVDAIKKKMPAGVTDAQIKTMIRADLTSASKMVDELLTMSDKLQEISGKFGDDLKNTAGLFSRRGSFRFDLSDGDPAKLAKQVEDLRDGLSNFASRLRGRWARTDNVVNRGIIKMSNEIDDKVWNWRHKNRHWYEHVLDQISFGKHKMGVVVGLVLATAVGTAMWMNERPPKEYHAALVDDYLTALPDDAHAQMLERLRTGRFKEGPPCEQLISEKDLIEL